KGSQRHSSSFTSTQRNALDAFDTKRHHTRGARRIFPRPRSIGLMMSDAIYAALKTVKDPELHRDLVSLGMIKNLEQQDSLLRLTIELTTPACPLKDKIQADVEAAVFAAVPAIKKIDITWGADVRAARPMGEVLPEVKNVILVGSGKGG